MTKEDKELLLKDICARLPYNVEMHIKGEYKTPRTIFSIYIEDKTVGYFKGLQYNEELIENVKLYLRPMSSMSLEECEELSKLKPIYDKVESWKYIKTPVPLYIVNIEQFDFFNSHHLDWRGLIPKGLALEATKDMYKF